MFDFLTTVYFLASVAAYVYVAVAVGKAADKGGASLPETIFQAAVWPYSIWKLVSDKYEV